MIWDVFSLTIFVSQQCIHGLISFSFCIIHACNHPSSMQAAGHAATNGAPFFYAGCWSRSN
jgi:hypothetical protein